MGAGREDLMRAITILGSTGSVGTQALDVVRRNRDRFRVVGVAAGGNDLGLLADQAAEFAVDVVAITDPAGEGSLRSALGVAFGRLRHRSGQYEIPEVLAGPDALVELAARPADSVLNAVAGSAGLLPTLAALEAGRDLALANKESLVIGGALVKDRAARGQIVPVDTEHAGLAQCLRGSNPSDVRQLTLTASGGPFLDVPLAQLSAVTPAQALAHPTWRMGSGITVNSATMVNKGLEVIEASLLFDVPIENVGVVIHPQSVVHAMVQFSDGSTVAQISPPDMRLALAQGLQWPELIPDAIRPYDWTRSSTWQFLPLDDERFPAVRLARQVGELGGTYPAVFNAANEECVAGFLAGGLPFSRIVEVVERVVSRYVSEHAGSGGERALRLPDVLAADDWGRSHARRLINRVPAAL
jgi:1-deoxy-D-xylulose-5-phosphate reductoisomerase